MSNDKLSWSSVLFGQRLSSVVRIGNNEHQQHGHYYQENPENIAQHAFSSKLRIFISAAQQGTYCRSMNFDHEVEGSILIWVQVSQPSHLTFEQDKLIADLI